MRIARNAICAWLAALFICAGIARADSILFASQTPAGGGAGVWDYTVQVTSLAVVDPGDFFVVIDFGGYVAGTITAPAGWSAVAELTTPSFVTGTGTITPATDDAATWNLRFTRTGASLGTGLYSGFQATTTLSGIGASTLVAQDHSTTVVGQSEGNTSPALVPVPLPPAVLGGIGLLGLVGVKKFRTRQLES